jgi:hypothetical protein
METLIKELHVKLDLEEILDRSYSEKMDFQYPDHDTLEPRPSRAIITVVSDDEDEQEEQEDEQEDDEQEYEQEDDQDDDEQEDDQDDDEQEDDQEDEQEDDKVVDKQEDDQEDEQEDDKVVDKQEDETASDPYNNDDIDETDLHSSYENEISEIVPPKMRKKTLRVFAKKIRNNRNFLKKLINGKIPKCKWLEPENCSVLALLLENEDAKFPEEYSGNKNKYFIDLMLGQLKKKDEAAKKFIEGFFNNYWLFGKDNTPFHLLYNRIICSEKLLENGLYFEASSNKKMLEKTIIFCSRNEGYRWIDNVVIQRYLTIAGKFIDNRNDPEAMKLKLGDSFDFWDLIYEKYHGLKVTRISRKFDFAGSDNNKFRAYSRFFYLTTKMKNTMKRRLDYLDEIIKAEIDYMREQPISGNNAQLFRKKGCISYTQYLWIRTVYYLEFPEVLYTTTNTDLFRVERILGRIVVTFSMEPLAINRTSRLRLRFIFRSRFRPDREKYEMRYKGALSVGSAFQIADEHGWHRQDEISGRHRLSADRIYDSDRKALRHIYEKMALFVYMLEEFKKDDMIKVLIERNIILVYDNLFLFNKLKKLYENEDKKDFSGDPRTEEAIEAARKQILFHLSSEKKVYDSIMSQTNTGSYVINYTRYIGKIFESSEKPLNVILDPFSPPDVTNNFLLKYHK